MYPTSPTVVDWRRAAADLARASGVAVPSWYTGQTADIQRLNADGLTDINAAILWFQNAYVVEHGADFPQANRDASAAFIAKNPDPSRYGASYKLETYGIGEMASDFVKEVGKEYVDTFYVKPYEAVKELLTGKEAVKADPKGFATVAVAGVALGAAVWFGWRWFKKGGN